jgi:hypothetical protein
MRSFAALTMPLKTPTYFDTEQRCVGGNFSGISVGCMLAENVQNRIRHGGFGSTSGRDPLDNLFSVYRTPSIQVSSTKRVVGTI